MPNLYLPSITKTLCATLDMPGSKSIANRVLLLAALAKGESIIHNVPDVSEDVCLMIEALSKLGVLITKVKTTHLGSSYRIVGCNGQFIKNEGEIFCGNSGTTMRFLTACLSLMSGNWILTGIDRMYERPILDLIDALTPLGVQIRFLQNNDYPPLEVMQFKDTKITCISISGKTSSQYLTGVLMALPLLKRHMTVSIYDEIISRPYIEMTIMLLSMFGVVVVRQDSNTYMIKGDSCLSGIEYTVEPDASSASYFLAMGAISGNITINNLSNDSLQGDKNFAHILAQMGAVVKYGDNFITVQAGTLSGIDINMEDMPDVAMTLAIVALFANGITTISGISNWKIKETNRILAMHNELAKLGAKIIIASNSITIIPSSIIRSNPSIDTYSDHRMAMCFSIIAVAGISVTIKGYECVGKTFSNYYDLFNQVCY